MLAQCCLSHEGINQKGFAHAMGKRQWRIGISDNEQVEADKEQHGSVNKVRGWVGHVLCVAIIGTVAIINRATVRNTRVPF